MCIRDSVRTPVWKHAEPATEEAFAELVEFLGEGAGEVEVGESFGRAIDMHRTIMEVDMAYNFHRDYEKGADKLSPVLRQLIERGRAYPAIEYTRAIGGIAHLNASLDAVFEEYDAILTPAAPARHRAASTAPAIRCFAARGHSWVCRP